MLILGVGNLLLSDEGVGIHIAQRLQRMSLPQHVEVIDGGTGGFELIRHFSGRSKVIIVDAVRADAEPGTVLRLTVQDVVPTRNLPFSIHQQGLDELLAYAGRMTPQPEIVILGIVPGEIGMGTSLSDAVERRSCEIMSLLVDELSSHTPRFAETPGS